MQNSELNYYGLGASLYIPSNHKDLIETVNREKFPNIKSVVICFEDSILSSQIDEGKERLKELLENLKRERAYTFLRPTNFEQFQKFLEFENIDLIDGFVIPKVNVSSIGKYIEYFDREFYFMPTLESGDVFELDKLRIIREALLPYRESILSLRIGSEDIGNILRIKRECETTIYDIPIYSHTISNIISTFKPYGFDISSPVFNCYRDLESLRREVSIDIRNGMFSKTAIHPSQIEIIQKLYRVTKRELFEAKEVLKSQSAIVGIDGKMFEKSTHQSWAREIVMRSIAYGVK